MKRRGEARRVDRRGGRTVKTAIVLCHALGMGYIRHALVRQATEVDRPETVAQSSGPFLLPLITLHCHHMH